jgi:spermidine/putrescine transport system substrate-binding protein
MQYGYGIGRREFLRGSAGVVLGSSLLTAGCGVGQETGSEEAVKKVVPAKVDGDLLVFNWTEYMDPELISGFEDRYKVKVRTANFDSMPSMMAKLRSGNAYDVIFPTADYVNRLVQANMLLQLDREKLRNADTTTRGMTRSRPTRSRTRCTRRASPGATTRSRTSAAPGTTS